MKTTSNKNFIVTGPYKVMLCVPAKGDPHIINPKEILFFLSKQIDIYLYGYKWAYIIKLIKRDDYKFARDL